jgi:hypothetical protein
MNIFTCVISSPGLHKERQKHIREQRVGVKAREVPATVDLLVQHAVARSS